MANGKLPPLRLLLSAVSISALNTFPSGYHMAVLNIPQSMLEQYVNGSIHAHYGHWLSSSQLTLVWSMIINLNVVFSLAGAFTSSVLAERFGRKFSLLVINNLLVVAASLMMGVSKWTDSAELFTIGRLLIGFTTGQAIPLLAVYLTECSPMRHRAFSATFINFFNTFATLVAEIVSLPGVLGSQTLWPLSVALAAIPALIQIATCGFFPESPSYLLLTKKDETGATKAVRFFHGDDANVEHVFEEFRKEKSTEKEQTNLKEVFSNRDYYWPILISVIINVTRLTSGITAIFSYSTRMYESVGLEPWMAPYATIVTSLFNLAGSFVSLAVVGRFGRRPLMLIGLIVCIICDVVFMVFSVWQERSASNWQSYVSLAAMLVFVTVFNVGPGPVGWFISSECTPQSVRSIGASISISSALLSAAIVGFIYLPLQVAVGPWSFLLFIVPTTIGVAFLWFIMPETKDKTIEEIAQTWRRQKREESTEDGNKGGDSNPAIRVGYEKF